MEVACVTLDPQDVRIPCEYLRLALRWGRGLCAAPVAVAIFVGTFAALIVVPETAEAQRGGPKRVYVEGFRGPQAGRVRGQLLGDLRGQASIELVDDAEVRRAAQELGVGRTRDADLAQIAAHLRISAIVDGRVARLRRGWSVTVRVRSGDGTLLGTSTWSGATLNALGSIRRSGYERLAPYFDAAAVPAAAAPTRQPEPYVAPSVDPIDPLSRPEEEDEEEEEEEEEETPSDGRYEALDVALLVGTLRRSMQTMVEPQTMSGFDPAEARNYVSGGLGHGEIGAAVEVYPGAFGRAQEVPYLGLRASYRHSIALPTSGCRMPLSVADCPMDQVVDIDASESELYLGGRARYRFGEAREDPMLMVDLGYGYFSFLLDPDDLQRLDRGGIIPPFEYTFIELGVGASYGVIPTYLTLKANVAFRLGLGVGDEALDIWGLETASTSGFSLSLQARTEIPQITEGAYVALDLSYFAFSTKFEGPTRCLNPPAPPDMCEYTAYWPSLRIPEPVSDTYFRLGLALGYLLR